MPMLLSKLSSVCVGYCMGQNVGGVLICGIISCFSREAKKLFLGVI